MEPPALPAELYAMIADNTTDRHTWLNLLVCNSFIYDAIDIRGRINARKRLYPKINSHTCTHEFGCDCSLMECLPQLRILRQTCLTATDPRAIADATQLLKDRYKCDCIYVMSCELCDWLQQMHVHAVLWARDWT